MEFDPAVPIWLQLVDEFKRRIAMGEWGLGQRINGVRDLAAEFGVNPNTVQRALAELDREGLSHSERTTGRYVTDHPDQVAHLRTKTATRAADDYVARAKGAGLRLPEALDLAEKRWTVHDADPTAPDSKATNHD